MKPLILAILIAASIAGPAEARHRKPEPPTLADAIAGAAQRLAHSVADSFRASGAALATASQRAQEGRAVTFDDGEVVAHPAGCPSRLFCGCGVSVKVYGRPIPALYPASAWSHFPKAGCGKGMVAVWGARHVAYILACNGDGTASVYDPNSGGGLTRIHTRELPSLIVEPPANL